MRCSAAQPRKGTLSCVRERACRFEGVGAAVLLRVELLRLHWPLPDAPRFGHEGAYALLAALCGVCLLVGVRDRACAHGGRNAVCDCSFADVFESISALCYGQAKGAVCG